MSTPTITHLSWGRIQVAVAGQVLTFKDCKIWPGGAAEWDWSVTDTHHHPGIQPADLYDLLAHDPGVVILSRGMNLLLQTTRAALQLLDARNIPCHILETNEAATLYNELAAQNRRPAALMHTTC